MNTSLDRGADELTQTLNRYVGDIVEGELRNVKNNCHKQGVFKLPWFENRSLLSGKAKKLCTENIGIRQIHRYYFFVIEQ